MNKAAVSRMVKAGRQFFDVNLIQAMDKEEREELKKGWDYLTGEWRVSMKALGMSDEEIQVVVGLFLAIHLSLSHEAEHFLKERVGEDEEPPTEVLHAASNYYVGRLQDNLGALLQLAEDLEKEEVK